MARSDRLVPGITAVSGCCDHLRIASAHHRRAPRRMRKCFAGETYICAWASISAAAPLPARRAPVVIRVVVVRRPLGLAWPLPPQAASSAWAIIAGWHSPARPVAPRPVSGWAVFPGAEPSRPVFPRAIAWWAVFPRPIAISPWPASFACSRPRPLCEKRPEQTFRLLAQFPGSFP
jgi:hypothetical protein